MAVRRRYLILFPMLITEADISGIAVYHHHGVEEAEMT
jgi:hypothetical protein